jgi:hypothetical protein
LATDRIRHAFGIEPRPWTVALEEALEAIGRSAKS